MILPMREQGLLFLFICLLGCGFGFLYDTLRIVKRVLGVRAFLGAVTDLLFWLFATLVVFYLLLGLNYGEVRIYMVFGFVGGMIVYYNSLSGAFIQTCERTLGLFKRFVLNVLTPVFVLVKIHLRFIKLLKLQLKKSLLCGIIKIRVYVKKSFSPLGRWLKWKKEKPIKHRKRKDEP